MVKRTETITKESKNGHRKWTPSPPFLQTWGHDDWQIHLALHKPIKTQGLTSPPDEGPSIVTTGTWRQWGEEGSDPPDAPPRDTSRWLKRGLCGRKRELRRLPVSKGLCSLSAKSLSLNAPLRKLKTLARLFRLGEKMDPWKLRIDWERKTCLSLGWILQKGRPTSDVDWWLRWNWWQWLGWG